MVTGRSLFEEAKTCSDRAAFWWLGQHSFIVKLGEVVLLIDPFLSPVEGRRVPPLFDPEDAKGIVSLVLCTHDHLDHMDPLAVSGLAKHTDALFIAPTAHTEKMYGLGVHRKRFEGLNDGEKLRLEGITVHAIKSAHEFFDQTPERYFPYLGYVLEGAKKCVYHAGDTVWWEGLQKRLSRWSFDAAMVPINGRDARRYADEIKGNMTFQEAADLVGGLRVGLSVPAHYDMFEFNAEDPEHFRAYMNVKYPDHAVWIGPVAEKIPF